MRQSLGLILFLALTTAPAVAFATPSLDVQANTSLQGEQSFSEVHVARGGKLLVKAHAIGDSDMAKGTLHIKATKIVVDEGGIIDGSGAGFQGADDQSGEGPGGGLVGVAVNEPGSGGGYVGAGSQGTDATCAAVGPAGGAAYSDNATPMMGSAGGAPKLPMGTAFPGGGGGGVLILEANTIEINGTVTVAGAPGTLNIGDAQSSGGGAGGTLWIKAFDFKVGPNAVVSAAGGDGPAGSQVSGGGGGGGLILLEAKAPMMWTPLLGGGVSGTCAGVTGGAGMLVQKMAPATCFDLDKDKVSACDGDCDDVDPNVYPSAPEKCDSVDNDCNGGIDNPEDTEELCAPGQVCDAGLDGGNNRCFAVDAGPDGGADAAYPKGIEYVGGCNTGHAGAASVLGAVVAWALALVGRRRRRPR